MRYVPGCVHHVKKMTGGVFEPVEPPIEKPEDPTTPPSTKDLRTIKIEENIMAVVGTNNWNAIAYGNGKYVAVGASGYVTTSTDGKTWTTPEYHYSYGSWLSIAYGNGKFVVAGNSSSNYIGVSTDGINWSWYNKPSGLMAYGMAYGNGKFVASSTNGRLYTSDDTGQTWSYIVPDIDGLSPANNDKYLNIVYNGEMFIAVGYNYSWNDDESRNLYTDIVTTSTDGVNWSTAVPIKDELGNVLRLTTLCIIAVSA